MTNVGGQIGVYDPLQLVDALRLSSLFKL